ncbi:MAG: hypothetical protein ACEQSL_01575 [Sediminibacterium sp.]
MAETRKNRAKNFKGAKGKPFTEDLQPSPELKKAGWAKRKFSRDLIKELLDHPYKFKEGSQIAEQLKQAFGDDILNTGAGAIITAQQIQKSILEGDTQSANNLFNQALGMPKQQQDISVTSPELIITRKVIGNDSTTKP